MVVRRLVRRPARPAALGRLSSRRLGAAMLACATGLAAFATVPVAAVESAASGVGAGGIGDAYFPRDGNGGYDVTNYDVDVRYKIDSGRLNGSTLIEAAARQQLDTFNLDLVLEPDTVLVDGTPAEFSKPNQHELVVDPTGTIPDGAVFTVQVAYHGFPQKLGYAGHHPWIRSGTEAMATNEPHIAPWWFPANDHPRDKATFDINVRVPNGNQAISNGELVTRETAAEAEWWSWTWRMDQPMATYLAFFAAGRFQIDEGVDASPEGDLPYLNAVSKKLPEDSQARAMKLMQRTPAVVRWLESKVGDYPFSSTGGVTTSLEAGFALENQGRPTYPYLGNNRYALGVVVHEQAHQWHGNSVSVDRWRDIWLNEGFATWWEWKYAETHGGRDAQSQLIQSYKTFPARDAFWRLRVGDPGKRHLFDYPVYERGAMTLQALRRRIGNGDYMTVLRTWVADRADGTGRVGQFKALAEQVSGQQLDAFFKTWLFTGEKPARTKANGLR